MTYRKDIKVVQKFRGFVIFAEMRTGSNLLEASLNAIKRVTCFGEAFNPYMMGWPDKNDLKGISKAQRDADPLPLLNEILGKPDHLSGFRYFHDHDPRVFDAIMDDPSCAKIILTRNPVDSYVSTKLARLTNQWKLNASEQARAEKIDFDAEEFRANVADIEAFQQKVMSRLQSSGQCGFWLGYEDLRDPEVLTGMLHWLGRTDLAKVHAASDQVPQNPQELSEKVSNFQEMEAELSRLDPFMLRRIPNFEPRKGPAVPSFQASEQGRGLIFMPMRGGPNTPVLKWLRSLGDLQGDFNQNTLRQWKRAHAGHRSFTVLRHPLPRAWAAFEQMLTGNKPELRDLMREIYRVPLPQDTELAQISNQKKLELFLPFLDFLRRSVSGQTSLAVQPIWATQAENLQGFGTFSAPDMVLRETDLARDLAWVAASAGVAAHGELPDAPKLPDFLDDPALRSAAKKAYLRDYVTFGFDDHP